MKSHSEAAAAQPKRRGEPWSLGSVLGYASANIFDRIAVTHADPLVGPFLRGIPSLVLGIVLVWKNKTLAQIQPGSPAYMGRKAILSFAVAGVLSTLGLFLYYFAIRVGGVVITIPALETYVIWGTLIAWFLLHERFHGFVLLGVGLIALGLVCVFLGQLSGTAISAYWYWAIPLALFTAVTYGYSGVLWREGQLLGAHQSAAIFLQFTLSVALGFLGLAVSGHLQSLFHLSRHDLTALLISGILSGVVGIYCMFVALRLMSVTRVYAFSSLTPLVAAIFAHFFLHEFLNLLMLAGILLVCVGVTLSQVYRSKDERQA